MTNHFHSSKTHNGNIRDNNEDNHYCGTHIFAICDGMGGQEAGEFASFSAVNLLPEIDAALPTIPAHKIDELVQEYVTRANNLLCTKMREKSIRMGTTLALVVITEHGIRPYTIGDSRIYDFSGGALRQISEDHTLTQQKVKMGILTPEQARHDRDRHKLTRYLGIFEDEMIIEAEPLPILTLTEHRRILLCSDGLTDMVEDSRIEEIIKTAPITDAAGTLVDEALANGGKDNITCIVIEVLS